MQSCCPFQPRKSPPCGFHSASFNSGTCVADNIAPGAPAAAGQATPQATPAPPPVPPVGHMPTGAPFGMAFPMPFGVPPMQAPANGAGAGVPPPPFMRK